MVAALVCTVAFMLCISYAADDNVSKVVGVVYTVLNALTKIIGGFMVISGIVSYVIAKQNDNGPDEHKAVTKMAVGLILILLFSIIGKDTLTTLFPAEGELAPKTDGFVEMFKYL